MFLSCHIACQVPRFHPDAPAVGGVIVPPGTKRQLGLTLFESLPCLIQNGDSHPGYHHIVVRAHANLAILPLDAADDRPVEPVPECEAETSAYHLCKAIGLCFAR